MKVLDLEKFAPDDREIHLNGKIIRVPGDLPVGLMLELLKAGDETDTDPLSQLNKSVDLMYKIIKLNPENGVDRSWIEELGRKQFLAIQNFILGQGGESVEEEPEKKEEEERAEP